MLTRNLSLIVIIVMVTCVMSGCGNKYLMPGLTLPPGSVEVSVTDSLHSGMPGMMPPGIGGSIKKSMTVEFSCSGGWGAVTSHFDSFMRGKGFEDSSQAMDDVAGTIPGSGNMKMSDMMRTYVKMGDKYSVSLMNSQAMMGMAGGSAQSAGLADFMLMVIQYD